MVKLKKKIYFLFTKEKYVEFQRREDESVFCSFKIVQTHEHSKEIFLNILKFGIDLVKKKLSIETDEEAREILGGFFRKYQKKVIAYFRVRYFNKEGKLVTLTTSSQSNQSKQKKF